ncbi:MAG TPA: MAPEG family protein [Pseudomonas sp.]|uniref:MAPEG family protein n=1 Tax=Pseudomonas sp. TaxID=306 RepID=UPI0026212662|nr:MAPEG family protein [Pseudomonas sp.]HSX90661.1 MAPEG family protein [Pseudomonas sp.]
MEHSLLAVLLYATWTLLLLGGIALLRVSVALAGKRAVNAFAVSGEDVSPFSARLCRAHANCYENLPIFAGLVLLAVASGNAAITAPLALWAVAARVGQSLVHLFSTSVAAVQLRFLFFLALWSIQAWWAAHLIGALL